MAEDEKKHRLPRGRKRLIYESFFTDEDVGSLTRDERLLLVAMIAAADDEGKGRANEIVLLHLAFSFDSDLTDRDVKKMREHIRRKMRNIEIYVGGGTWFYCFKNWRRYQRVDHFEASFFPDFGEKPQRSGDEPLTGQQRLPSVDSLRLSSSLGDKKPPSLVKPSLAEPSLGEPARGDGKTSSGLKKVTKEDLLKVLAGGGDVTFEDYKHLGEKAKAEIRAAARQPAGAPGKETERKKYSDEEICRQTGWTPDELRHKREIGMTEAMGMTI